MVLKPELMYVLRREKMVCETAITRLQEKTQFLEERFGWSTETFLAKFNSGKVGDDLAFFRWYAFAEATREWETTYGSLQELFADSGLISA